MLVGLLSYAGITINQKILFCSQAVKGEIALENSLGSLTHQS